MTPSPGYLLPDGECYTEELACALVFYPDKPEYRRALLGSIVYLSKWLAWERDSDKRGKDAARAWQNAVDETLECWTMTCLEEMIADMAAMRALMQTKKDCCDDNVSYFPGPPPETEITPQIGDPPEYYGETAVTDWEDWSEHVCYNAHAYVDYLISTSQEIHNAVQTSSIFLGIIAAALTLLAFSGIGLPIAFGLASWVVTGLALSATITTFANTAASIEAARDSIVCVIINGFSLPDAIEDALSSGTDWDLFYQFVDYDSAAAVLYEGGVGNDYLPSETRDDCVCDAEGQFLFEWPTDLDGWIDVDLTLLWDANEYITATPSTTGGWKDAHLWRWDLLATRFGFSLPVTVDQVRFKFNNHSDGGSAVRHLFKMTIYGSDPSSYSSQEWDTNDFADDEWHEIIWNFPGPLISHPNAKFVRLWMYRYGTVTTLRRMWIDDFGVYKR